MLISSGEQRLSQMKKKQQSLKVSPLSNIFTNNQSPNTPTIHSNSEYLYTPTQYLISNFLTTKKTIEDNLITTLKSITDIRSNPQINTRQLRQELNSKKKQLQGIKRKLNKSFQQQTQVYDIMKKRIHRHQPVSSRGRINTTDKTNQSANKTNAIFTNQQQQQQSPILTKQPTIVEQPQKDDLLHPDRIFQLQMNKQIVYFMVDQSVKMEQKLNYQEKLKSQLKLKKEEEEKHRIQAYQLKEGENNKLINKNDQKDNKNQTQQRRQSSNNNLNNNDPTNRIMYQTLPFVFIEEIQSQNSGIEINIDEDIFDLQRFFTMQDDEMNIQLMNFQNRYGVEDRQFVRFNRILSKNGNKKQQQQKEKLLEDLQYTRRDLFGEKRFVQYVQKDWQNLLNNEMDLQVEGTKSPIQQSKRTIGKSASFQGQLQLECMLYRKQHQISQDILSNNLQSISQFLYENTHMVNKNNSHLEFWLTLCKAVQLIKTKIQQQEMHALQIIRNMIARLKSQLESWQKSQLQKVTCMLLLPQKNIDIKPYLQKIQQSFKTVFQQIYKLPDFTRFLHTIYTGALILKTPTCIEKDKENPLICPLCNPLAQKVFTNIPLLTRNQSSLICRINGTVMDHENYPIMLPSYQIYSFKGLQDTKKTTKINTGKVIEEYYCKFTETWYNKELAKKVFLA